MVNIIGVRRAESTKRAKRNSVELNGRRFSGTIDQFNAALSGESVVSACMAKFNDKDKVMILPIIDWTDSDVWSFIKNYLKIPYCKLYDEGRTRIGCILCPMSTRGELARESKRYPKYVDAYRRVINRLIAKGYFKGFEDADDVLSWWSSKESVKKYFENKKQLKLF